MTKPRKTGISGAGAVVALAALSSALFGQTLPGTQPLQMEGDPVALMLDGMDRYLDRATAASVAARQAMWQRDYTSCEAYEGSVKVHRERLRRMLGAIDARVPAPSLVLDATLDRPAAIASAPRYTVYAVRWPVFAGADAEGLLLKPRGPPVARVVALPDAGWTPEMTAGLEAGLPPAAQFARRLAEAGCEVLVPALIDRGPTGLADARIPHPTNQSRREFLYRMAFEVGRHPIGYDVEKVSAALDWFAARTPRVPLGVFGYGEGGAAALFSAALDTRIAAVAVSGYFQRREALWREPVYRNLWGFLTEFGDAEVASLVAPRGLVVEAARVPAIVEFPPVAPERRNEAAPGQLSPPPLGEVRAEFERARTFYSRLGAESNLALAGEGGGEPGSPAAMAAFFRALGVQMRSATAPGAPPRRLHEFDAGVRQRRQFEQWMAFTQTVLRGSEFARKRFWSKGDASSIERWNESKQPYRRYLWEEVLGKLPAPSEPLSARTRLIYRRPAWTGYEVQLPVLQDVFAYGYLFVPAGLKPGERRPVVVCQHGRGGRPVNLVEPPTPAMEKAYKRVAAQLAERGFVVYAPQNPYIFEEHYRLVQRKANPLKLSLFSFILGQHERTLEWLAGLPFVDPARIGFYGLSYGGKTAMRVPSLLDRYALSICSGDFNEYSGKIAGTDRPDSFLYTDEYEMYEFDLANTFNYSELASLMAPRPFMVERGRKDGIAFDHWVAYEYAKVERFYTLLGIPGRTEIEFFNSGHEIHGEGTFRFLHRHLRWPAPDTINGRTRQ